MTWDDEREDVDGDELEGDELEGDELEGDEQGEVGVLTMGQGAYRIVPIPGTVNRPLLGKAGQRWDPTVRWGDRVEIQVEFPLTSNTTFDLLNVKLPKAATCQILFHSAVLTEGVDSQVSWTELELFVGNGSAISRIVKRYQWLPQRGANGAYTNINDIWTLPMSNIRGRVRVFGDLARVECALGLCPLSRDQ